MWPSSSILVIRSKSLSLEISELSPSVRECAWVFVSGDVPILVSWPFSPTLVIRPESLSLEISELSTSVRECTWVCMSVREWGCAHVGQLTLLSNFGHKAGIAISRNKRDTECVKWVSIIVGHVGHQLTNFRYWPTMLTNLLFKFVHQTGIKISWNKGDTEWIPVDHVGHQLTNQELVSMGSSSGGGHSSPTTLGSARGSAKGSARGSARGSAKGSAKGSEKWTRSISSLY